MKIVIFLCCVAIFATGCQTSNPDFHRAEAMKMIAAASSHQGRRLSVEEAMQVLEFNTALNAAAVDNAETILRIRYEIPREKVENVVGMINAPFEVLENAALVYLGVKDVDLLLDEIFGPDQTIEIIRSGGEGGEEVSDVDEVVAFIHALKAGKAIITNSDGSEEEE